MRTWGVSFTPIPPKAITIIGDANHRRAVKEDRQVALA